MRVFKLSEILSRAKKTIIIEDSKIYKRITIKMNGKGVLLRDKVKGDKIGTKKQFIVNKEQFILSKIDARNGAFGVIPDDCDQGVITGNFWTFNVDEELANIEYLNFISQTPSFVDFCIRASEGTTNRKYLDEKMFLSQKVELPDLVTQSEIVNKANLIQKNINKIKIERELQIEFCLSVLDNTFQEIIADAPYKTMAEVAPIVRRKQDISFDGKYPELGARSFGKGIFHKPTLIGSELEWQKLFNIHSGDLVMSNIKAWEGAIAAAGERDKDRVASHRYITCVPKTDITNAKFLSFYLLSNEGIEKIRDASPGSADRNRTLGMRRLEKIEVPVPNYNEQLWFNKLQKKVSEIKDAQKENETELIALMPSILDKAFKGELI
ncbi:MAG: type I restriction enzyme S subunit [Oleiphilaceae bacterium]|jgi:type I restriction enzyme S subunit